MKLHGPFIACVSHYECVLVDKDKLVVGSATTNSFVEKLIHLVLKRDLTVHFKPNRVGIFDGWVYVLSCLFCGLNKVVSPSG